MAGMSLNGSRIAKGDRDAERGLNLFHFLFSMWHAECFYDPFQGKGCSASRPGPVLDFKNANESQSSCCVYRDCFLIALIQLTRQVVSLSGGQ